MLYSEKTCSTIKQKCLFRRKPEPFLGTTLTMKLNKERPMT